MQDINPLSVNPWKTSRVTLISDAAVTRDLVADH
jgi:hypothetical protein